MSNQYEIAGNRGHSYIWEQKWKEAIREFKVALNGLTDDPGLHDGLATAYREVGDLQNALHHFQEATRISGGEAIYLEQVADIHQKLGDYKAAAEALLQVGEFRLNQNRLEDAVNMWLLSARLDPDLLKPHERLATVYYKQNKSYQAVNEYLELARIYEQTGQLNKAVNACQHALKLDPRNPTALTAIELLRSGGRAFGGAGAGGNTSNQAHNHETFVLPVPAESSARDVYPVRQLLDNSRERIAEDIISGDGGFEQLQLMTTLSQALDYQTRGKLPEAIESYEKVLRNNSHSNVVLFNLAYLYQENNRFEESIDLLKRLISDPEYHLVAHYLLGDSYRALGEIGTAVGHFVEVVQYMDMPTVPQSQVPHLQKLYQELRESLIRFEQTDQANEFANSLTHFLSRKDWSGEVSRARQKLDGLSGLPGSMILGEILLTGSARILESLYLAQEYTQDGYHDAALEEIYRAIEVSPSYLPAHIEMADLLVKLGRLRQAAAKLEMVGYTFQVRGDKLGAIGAYRRAVKAFPHNHDLRTRLIDMLRTEQMYAETMDQYLGQADAYYQSAQLIRARQSYIDGLRLSQQEKLNGETRVQLLKGLGDIEMQRLNWKQALPIYQELRRQLPQDKQVSLNYISLLYRFKKDTIAIKEVDRLLVTLVKAKRGGEIISLLQRLVNDRPTDALLVDRLAKLYVHQKEPQKAIAVLDQLGEYQMESGDRMGAAKTISRILALKPDNADAYQLLLAEIKSG